MTAVKVVPLPPLPDGAEAHVVALAARLLEVARRAMLTQGLQGLRPSHLRLLSQVPTDGITSTELAGVLLMTKQGVGQFVTQLQASGHLEVTVDRRDRRRRLVRRTASGDEVVRDVGRTIAGLEDRWRGRIGEQRYAVFRDVLRQIADDGQA